MSDRKQLILDTCGTHLLTQMKESKSFDGNCCYFSHDGLKCGAAPVLNEQAYNDRYTTIIKNGAILNSRIISRMDQKYFKEEFKNLTHEEMKFLSKIQTIHDSEPIKEWHACLCLLAERHELNTDKLDALRTKD